jgi:glycerophosphoryl diester phosphodiesterase
MQIHSKRQTLIVAHRGASHAAPENTLPAFRLAIEEDADFIEGDFWLTKDRHIVCIHDPDTARVSCTHSKLDVRSSTLRQLKALELGECQGKQFKGTSIPTLPEILEILPPEKGIFLEIKDPRTLFLEKLLPIARRYGLTPDRMRLIAFDPEVIRRAREYFPQHKIYWLYNWYLAKETGLLSNSPKEILKILRLLPCDGLNLNPAPWIDIDFVRQLRKMNMDFCVYNVNHFDDALKLITLGVDAIATNYPAKMRAQIARYFAPAPVSRKKAERVSLNKGQIDFKNTFE